jgi:hypothetical protein
MVKVTRLIRLGLMAGRPAMPATGATAPRAAPELAKADAG